MSRALWAILIIAFLLRLIVAILAPQEFVFSDSDDYHSLANSLLNGKGLSRGAHATASRPPLYPFFLSCLYALGLGITSVRIIQSIIGAFTVWLQYKLALACCKQQKIAYIAALIFALDPFQIMSCSLILTETLFTTLLLACMLLLYKFWEKNCPSSFVFLAGICIGFGCLCRTSLSAFLPLILILLFLRHKGEIKKLLLLLLGAFIVIFPWSMRNYYYFDRWIPVTTQMGHHMYETLGPQATGGPIASFMKLPQETESMDESQRDVYLKKLTLQYIYQDPIRVIKLAWVKFLRFWSIDFNDGNIRKHIVRWPVIIFTTIIYVAVLFSIFAKNNHLLFLWIPIVYFTLIHSIFMGSIRYRIPIMPYLEIMAAFSIVLVGNFRSKK